MTTSEDRRAWLVFFIEGQRYAIPVDCIDELLREDALQAVSLPGLSGGMTGLVRWRERVVPQLDLRTVLGLPTMAKQTAGLIETLKQREADHVKWLHELEASVNEDRPFTLATDPHKCAFGKWYDQVRSDPKLRDAFTNRNMGLQRVLEAFDTPHCHIHGIAHEIENLKQSQDFERARELINQTRGTVLASMVKLFNEARDYIQRLHRSMEIILHHGGEHLCLMIDSIDLIIEVDNASLQAFDRAGDHTSLPIRVSRCGEDQDLVMHIEPADLLRWYAAQPDAA